MARYELTLVQLDWKHLDQTASMGHRTARGARATCVH